MKIGDRVKVKDEAVGKNLRHNTERPDGGYGTIIEIEGTGYLSCHVRLDGGPEYYYDETELTLLSEYTPIEHEGKVYTQLKEITGEAIYLAQEDKDCREFREEFRVFSGGNGFLVSITLDDVWIKILPIDHPLWLPFLEQHGLIKIEDAEPELKPCPFCGGKAKVVHSEIDDWFRVVCSTRSCAGLKTNGYATNERAIEAWNKRV